MICGLTDKNSVYLDKYEELKNRLDNLEDKYGIPSVFMDDSHFFMDKLYYYELMDEIIETINEYIVEFNESDYTQVPDTELGWETGDLKSHQQNILSWFPGKTYAQVQKAALRSFKQLKKDCLEFIDEIASVPEKILPMVLAEHKSDSE